MLLHSLCSRICFFELNIRLWMTDFVTERLVLFETDVKVLLVVFKVGLGNFCDVLLDIGERIGDIFFAPDTRVKQDI